MQTYYPAAFTGHVFDSVRDALLAADIEPFHAFKGMLHAKAMALPHVEVHSLRKTVIAIPQDDGKVGLWFGNRHALGTKGEVQGYIRTQVPPDRVTTIIPDINPYSANKPVDLDDLQGVRFRKIGKSIPRNIKLRGGFAIYLYRINGETAAGYFRLGAGENADDALRHCVILSQQCDAAREFGGVIESAKHKRVMLFSKDISEARAREVLAGKKPDIPEGNVCVINLTDNMTNRAMDAALAELRKQWRSGGDVDDATWDVICDSGLYDVIEAAAAFRLEGKTRREAGYTSRFFEFMDMDPTLVRDQAFAVFSEYWNQDNAAEGEDPPGVVLPDPVKPELMAAMYAIRAEARRRIGGNMVDPNVAIPACYFVIDDFSVLYEGAPEYPAECAAMLGAGERI
jgi:hypothetical protein